MALDVFVMPLLKFKKGEHCAPVEAVVAHAGSSLPHGKSEGNAYELRLAARKCATQVDAILETVRCANKGKKIEWPDEGDIAFQQSVPWTFAGLKAYARWIDLSDFQPDFPAPPDSNWTHHPALTWKGDRPWTFPLLHWHDLHSGYLLPCDFEKGVQVEQHRIAGVLSWKMIASAPRALDEIEGLAELLSIGDEEPQDDGSAMSHVRMGAYTLRKALRIGNEKRLPTIFCE